MERKKLIDALMQDGKFADQKNDPAATYDANTFFVDIDFSDVKIKDPLPFDLYIKEQGRYIRVVEMGSVVKPGVEPYKKVVTAKAFGIREEQGENFLNYLRSGKKPHYVNTSKVLKITDDIFENGNSVPEKPLPYNEDKSTATLFIDFKIGLVLQREASGGVLELQYGPRPLEAKGLADYVFNLSELEASMGQLRKVIRIQPKNWQSIVALAKCYYVMGWVGKAKATFVEALKFKKDDPDLNLLDAFLDQQVRLEKLKKMDSKKKDDEFRELNIKKANANLDRIFNKNDGKKAS